MEPVRPLTGGTQAERRRPEELVSGAVVDPLPPGLFPPRVPLDGESMRLEPLDPGVHASDLYAASHEDERARSVWTYLWPAPFADAAAFAARLRDGAAAADPLFYAIRDRATGRAAGMALQPQMTFVGVGLTLSGQGRMVRPPENEAQSRPTTSGDIRAWQRTVRTASNG